MTWDRYPVPVDTVVFGEGEADLITDQELAEVVSLNASIAGKPVDYSSMLIMLRDIARSSAVRGFVSGYNRAIDETNSGKTPKRLTVTKKTADQR